CPALQAADRRPSPSSRPSPGPRLPARSGWSETRRAPPARRLRLWRRSWLSPERDPRYVAARPASKDSFSRKPPLVALLDRGAAPLRRRRDVGAERLQHLGRGLPIDDHVDVGLGQEAR